MKKLVTTFSFLSTLLLTSCSSNEDIRVKNLCTNPDNLNSLCEIEPLLAPLKLPEELPKSVSYQAPIYFAYLPEYTEQLAYKLKESLNSIELDGSIAVSNFVPLSESIKGGSMLGRQVAELLASDLQNNKLPISISSLGSYIDVKGHDITLSPQLTPKNTLDNKAKKTSVDDILTDDILALSPNITYVCTGTLMETKQGVLINAKVIHRKTLKIVASANKTLPFAVLNVERNKP